MTKNTQDIRKGQVAARAARLVKPREPRMGKIKLGYQVHKCRKCNKTHKLSIETCPDCSGTEWGHGYPQKTNHYVFYDDGGIGAKVHGHNAPIIPFTFKAPPVECVMVRRECYQGGKLYCCCPLVANPATGDYTNPGIAYRNRQEVKCDPETCPLSVGGNVTIGGKSRVIDPERPQCGESVTIRIWLPDCEGFDVYEHKSGSIETINNVQSAVKTLTGMMNQVGGYLPLRLELKLKKVTKQYTDLKTGIPKRAEFYASVIHFPFSIVTLQDQSRAGTLQLDKVMYSLPTGLNRKAVRMLPEPTEGNYDELIDGPRQVNGVINGTQNAQNATGTPISDLTTQSIPKTVQTHTEPTRTQIDKFRAAFDILTEGMDKKGKTEVKAELNKVWGVAIVNGKIDPKSVSTAKMNNVIEWLNSKIAHKAKVGLEEDTEPLFPEGENDK